MEVCLLKIFSSILLVVGCGFVSSAAFAQLKTTTKVVTNYLARGVTLNADKPAIQGILQYTKKGWKAKAFASQYQLGEKKDTIYNVLFSKTWTLKSNVQLELGYSDFSYLEKKGFSEAYLRLSRKQLSLKYWAGTSVDWEYLQLLWNHRLPRKVNLLMSASHWSKKTGDSADYSLIFSRNWNGLTYQATLISSFHKSKKDEHHFGLGILKTW